MTMWQYFNDNWFMALLAGMALYGIGYALLFRLPNRIIRSRNIKNQGWPPEHLDADGDFKQEEDSNDR